MGTPLKHIRVKLIVGLISGDPRQFDAVRRVLEKQFGSIDNETQVLDFSCTSYYEEELGKNLKRSFLSFKKLIEAGRSYNVKLYTNALEKDFSKNGKRTVNIDPGYVSLTKLVLFTAKNRSHRIYLSKGIYADQELMFENKSFRPLDWAFTDYRTAEYIDFFNSVRATYFDQIKNKIHVPQKTKTNIY